MRYCGHFLIKAEGGAKNYKRDHPLPLSWRPFTFRFLAAKGLLYRGGSRISKGGALLTRVNKLTLLATSTNNSSSFMGMYLILCQKVLD